MIERVVGLAPEKAFEELRNLLLKSKCKITAEEQTKSITVEQGSLWGASPKGVKIDFHFLPKNSGTRVVSTSSLTSDFIMLSVVGYILVGFLGRFFWSFSMYLESRFAGLFMVLAIIMAIGIVASLIFDVYLYAKIDSFAEETLRLLP